ncbi:uncharacterized protein ACIBXB_000292 [Morphnus guianensis]
MKKKIRRVLVPLFFHMNDQSESVAKASGEALLTCADLLKRKELKQLARTKQTRRIGEALLVQDRRRMEEYLHHSLPYLKDAQATLRVEAIRFIGLAARHLRDRNEEELQDMCRALQPLVNDAEPSVRSLATQTLLILAPLQPTSGWSLRRLCWIQWVKGKWQTLEKSGLPGELPGTPTSQKPMAAQHALTQGVLVPKP